MTLSYADFLQSKLIAPRAHGFDVAPGDVNPILYPFQRDIVRWACRLGRAALFEECGLGKTFQQLEWARLVVAHTGGRVLVVAPLAVAYQTTREAARLGLDVPYVRSQAAALAASSGIAITNYDMLKEFDAGAFAGVVLDESSILKAFSGKTKRMIVDMFAPTPYRLACTATPAPNDHMELGNHAEFLGVMPSNEMLSRWFINDTMNFQHYRLKGHARADFWRWLTSWSVCIGKPGDLGAEYDMPEFVLPELRIVPLMVKADHTRAFADGRLLVADAPNATAVWRDKAITAAERCEHAARLASAAEGAVVVWCDTNQEADLLKRHLPDAVEVRGSETPDAKERKLRAFTDGEYRVIITKPDLAAFGLNWQHAATQVFAGVTYSFEKTYQALRRSWRYGQTQPVTAHVIYSESEGNIMTLLHQKQAAFDEMRAESSAAMTEHGLFRDGGACGLTTPPSDVATGRNWTLHLGDCVAEIARVPDDSVQLSVFSPPFSNLYIYSDSVADMGNAADDREFLEHYGHLAPELLRITAPGRLCVIHCKDLPRYMTSHGAAGLFDLPGELTRVMETAGWQYHSKVTIWKDPVIEMQRTKSYGLLHKSFESRTEVCRQGMPDYLIVFRKWTDKLESGAVTQRREPGDYIGESGPETYKDRRGYSIQVWQRYASPVWFDINQTRVLNVQQARASEDEKHICPLQLDVIARCVDLWTMPGEMVFSPFAGIGSEGYEAVRMGRQFTGIELKPEYWRVAAGYLRAVEAQPALFDLSGWADGDPEVEAATAGAIRPIKAATAVTS